MDKKKAIFLDRDGVINEAIVRNGKPYSPKNINELRVGAKTAIWLPKGSSGDRAELNFKGLERNFYRISAEGSKQCVYNYPNCFLRKVREEAHQSDLLIVCTMQSFKSFIIIDIYKY